MLKNKLLVLFCVLVVLTSVVGCCSKDEDGDYTLGDSSEIANNTKTMTSEVVDGKLVVTGGGTEGGVQIATEENTFTEGAVITILENDFAGKGSNYLTNARKSYSILGVMESSNPLVPSYPIDTVDEPVSVKIPNTISGDVEAYYLGIRENGSDEWKFERLNEEISSNARMNVNMVRAAKSNDFTFKTNKLNIEVALFANVRGSDKILPATVINAINTVVEAANAGKSEKGKMPIKENAYTDDMKITVEIGGKNVDYLKLSDYIAELTYVNNDSRVNKKIAGNSASYQNPKYTPGLGSGQKWTHSIVINDLEGSADKVQFTVNTNGMKTEEFPQKFSVGVKNKNTASDVLPFGYNNSIKVENTDESGKQEKPEKPEEPQVPAVPTDVLVSAERIKNGDSVILTWKKGTKSSEGEDQGEAEDITFTIALAKDGGEKQVVAEDLTETEWESEPLEIGAYSATVMAVNKGGSIAEAEAVTFEVVDSAFSTPVIEELKPYYALGEAVEIKWSEVKDALGNKLNYNVVVYNSQDDVVAEANDSELTAIKLESLPLDTYKVLVAATDGKNTSELATREFKVIDITLPAPVFANMANSYKTGENIDFTWSEVKDPVNKPVSYRVVITGDTLGNPVEASAEETSWSINTLNIGNYTAKVIASNGDATSESETVNFSVMAGAPTAPVINEFANVYKLGDTVLLTWLPSIDPFNKPITYDLYLYTGDSATTPVLAGANTTAWVSSSLATGTYNIRLVASNGTESTETAIKDAFTVMTSSRASISDVDGCVYAQGIYNTKPEFIVEISEKNFDEHELSKVITVEGIPASNVSKTWVDGKLKLGFNDELALGQTYKISMGAIKDKYDNDITPFAEKTINVIPFPGTGSEADPFVPGAADAVYVTAGGQLALISGLKTEVGVFKDMVFSNAAINANGSVKWSNLDVTNTNDSPVVEIPDTELWPANSTVSSVNMTFNGTIEGKTYKFVTIENNYVTESGLVISLGDGSDTNPYLVYTPAQLIEDVRNYTHNEKFIKQLRNIDLANYSSSNYDAVNGLSAPICNYSNSLTGVYDGNNKVIDNLIITSTSSCMGLFGTVSSTGTDSPWGEIRNLGLTNVNVSAGGTSGALVGECCRGKINNCYVTGTVLANGCVGGLIGRVYGYGQVTGCHFHGVASNTGYITTAGGIMGMFYGYDEGQCFMDGCYVTDSTIGGGGRTGGLVGDVQNVKYVQNCYVERCNVSGREYNNGGLIGYIQFCSLVNNCYVKDSNIFGPSYTGGVIGDVCSTHTGDKITNCYGTGLTVSASGQYVGGFFGYGPMDIDNCYVEVESVSGSEYVGGFMGYRQGGGVKNSYAVVSGNVTGNRYVGGFCGYFSGSDFSNCHCETGDISAASGGYCGGLVGAVWCNGIKNCYAKVGNVTGPVYTGGLVGYCSSSLTNSYVDGGLVSGVGYSIGGLVGENNNKTTNCYTTCTVEYNGTNPTPKTGMIFGNMCNSESGSCFTTQTPSGSIPLVGYGSDVTNCHSLPDGYDSVLNWSSKAWDLSKPLPTLN